MLIGDEQIDVPPPAQGTVACQATDGGEVVRFEPESTVVELGYGRIGDAWRIEAIHISATRLLDARRLILEPRLIFLNLARLRRTSFAAKDLQPLPPKPRKLVVVPDRHERPARSRVLQIRIVQIGPVHRAVIVDGRRDVKIADLFSARVAHNVAQPPIVVPLRPVVWIPNDLIDEVAEMKDEVESFGLRGPFVLEDHAAVRVLRTLIDVLAAHKREARCVRVIAGRRSPRAAKATRETVIVDESIPVHPSWSEPTDERATRPIRFDRYRHARRGDHPSEAAVLRDLHQETSLPPNVLKGAPGPQEDAVRLRIAGSDTLGIEIAPLFPCAARRPRKRAARDERRAQRGGGYDEAAPAELSHGNL